jgi:hypothetical protein
MLRAEVEKGRHYYHRVRAAWASAIWAGSVPIVLAARGLAPHQLTQISSFSPTGQESRGTALGELEDFHSHC